MSHRATNPNYPTVNIPLDKETDEYSLASGIPNEGVVTLTCRVSGAAGFRLYGWVKQPQLYLNGEKISPMERNGVIYACLTAGDTLELRFALETEKHGEHVRGVDYTVVTRACDVVDLLPRGEHIRLYQRDLSVPKYYPRPEDVSYLGAANYGPTQQSEKYKK